MESIINSTFAINLMIDYAVIILKVRYISLNPAFLTLIKLISFFKHSSVAYALILLEIHAAVGSAKSIFAKFA
jgi:hypothetical protein